LDNIRREAERIQQLIDQLLQLAALEGRRDLGPTQLVPLAPLVNEVEDSLSTLIAAKRVVFENSVEATNLRVRAEPFLLRLALMNLFKNAIEFSPVEGKISVSAKIERGRVRISVEDEGPGIPDFARERIFERFYSLPRPSTGVKSTGLGLSFVQEIVHLHGGTIRIENRADGGCRAELAL
jgi:two-component system, OmpR family, sensor histidine kinase CreC